MESSLSSSALIVKWGAPSFASAAATVKVPEPPRSMRSGPLIVKARRRAGHRNGQRDVVNVFVVSVLSSVVDTVIMWSPSMGILHQPCRSKPLGM